MVRDSEGETGDAGTTEDVDDSMTGQSPTGEEDDDESGGEEFDDEGPWDETGTFPDDDDGGGTGDYVECVDEDLPACTWEGTDCVYRHGWHCNKCIGDVSKEVCYEAMRGCEYPWLECPELPTPCGVVRVLGADPISGFEDQDAATCLLQSLRDGVAGMYTIEWGEATADDHWPHAEVFVGGEGIATMQYEYRYVCTDCASHGNMGRTFGMGLRPASFFDECLESPTTESLALCILGFTEFEADNPPGFLWTPPFMTGECVDEVFECPPA
jgi:hypothetical protein